MFARLSVRALTCPRLRAASRPTGHLQLRLQAPAPLSSLLTREDQGNAQPQPTAAARKDQGNAQPQPQRSRDDTRDARVFLRRRQIVGKVKVQRL